MVPPSIPEEESRKLVNSMDAHLHLITSLDEQQKFNRELLSFSDIRNSMGIESAEQDIYINVLCDLLDESVQYNDSKQVMLVRIK